MLITGCYYSLFICVLQKTKHQFPIPAQFEEFSKVYKESIQIQQREQFVTNFLGALKAGKNVTTSRYMFDQLWWGRGFQHVAEKLAIKIQLMENDRNHCSSIVTGLKGVGKSTMYVTFTPTNFKIIICFRVKCVAMIAAMLSDNIISVYCDVSTNTSSPMQIIYEAFVKSGIATLPTHLYNTVITSYHKFKFNILFIYLQSSFCI